MSGISKRVSGSWVSGDYGIMKTATDTITTLPADIYANSATATVGLKGQTVQSGTPAPQNPIQPSECGNMTENLFGETMVSGYHLNITTGLPETYGNNSRCANLTPIDVSNYNTVTFSFINKLTDTKYFMYSTFNGNSLIERVASKISGDSIDVSNATKLYIAVYSNLASVDCAETITNVMLNSGSTPLPYEPHGYKIPISSAGQTTPVYLGEVQTTRKIYKMRLTNPTSATETPNGYRLEFSISSHPAPSYQSGGGMCNITTWNGDYSKNGFVASNLKAYITQNIAEWATKEGATAWLDEHEVYIWYILATEETAVVNEPLMKIGDYADEVSNISIPVTAGGDTLSVGTTLQPSEVTANYKGWHPVQNVHERDNGAWT